MLDTYKTNPSNELAKIDNLLIRKERVIGEGQISFKYVLNIVFKKSIFGGYETDLDAFINNVIKNNREQMGEELTIVGYRYLCEMLIELLDIGIPYDYEEYFCDDAKQLKTLVYEGLKSTGYNVINYKDYKVTKKIDEEAEAVAATNPEYKEFIFDYLIAKNKEQKESALTRLSIKLEGLKSKDAYIKANREYVQFLRHKEEFVDNPKYSWFFNKSEYGNNLDNLFKIFIATISYNSALPIIEYFRKQCGGLK